MINLASTAQPLKPKLTVPEQPPPPEIAGQDEIRSPVPQKPVIEPVKQSIRGDELKLKEREELLAHPKSPYEPKWRKSDSDETPEVDESEKETEKQRITEPDSITKLAGIAADEMEKKTEKQRVMEPKTEIAEKEEAAAEKKVEKQGIVEQGTGGIKKLGTAAEIAA